MKFALLIGAVLLVFWLWGGRKRAAPPPTRPSGQDDTSPRPMLACAVCGMHLPRDEALPGRGGVFCGEPHRQAYERDHPGE